MEGCRSEPFRRGLSFVAVCLTMWGVYVLPLFTRTNPRWSTVCCFRWCVYDKSRVNALNGLLTVRFVLKRRILAGGLSCLRLSCSRLIVKNLQFAALFFCQATSLVIHFLHLMLSSFVASSFQFLKAGQAGQGQHRFHSIDMQRLLGQPGRLSEVRYLCRSSCKFR